jgi:hypothetical protein
MHVASLCALLLCFLFCGVAAAKGVKRRTPMVTDAKTAAAQVSEGNVSFTLTLKGAGFGKTADRVSLVLLNSEGEDAIKKDKTTIESVEDGKVVFNVVASPGPYSLRLKIGKVSADTSAIGPVAPDAKGPDAKKAGMNKTPAHIGIEYDQFAYPSDGGLKKYSLVVKRTEGDKLFETDPRLISLSLTPAGAADVTIRRVTPTRIEADFWGPDKFEVEDVSVSVYDPNDPQSVIASSDVPKPKAQDEGASGEAAAKAKGKSDADQPEITSTAVVFLQRAYGIGRLKIEGKNFGSYPAPPVSAEDYLLCFEPLARQALISALSDSHPGAAAQKEVEDGRCAHVKGTNNLRDWNAWRADVEKRIKVALVPRNTDLRIEQAKVLYADDKMIDVYFEFNRYYRHSEPLRLASTTVTIKKGGEAKSGAKSDVAANGSGEAAGGHGASGVVAAGAGASAEKAQPAVVAKATEITYIATKEVGTKQDENLEYRYTVLDETSATTLFGKGVANSFYVIQLSVTNKGDKKIAVPLASVQAEVEWAYGPNDEKTKGKAGAGKPDAQYTAAQAPFNTEAKEIAARASMTRDFYEEGPATLAPLPLPAVSAFFDGDMKVNGRKAKFFNITDGLATLGSSLIPFIGPGFRDAHVAFTGGLVPGIRRSLGDLSGQQLQNLTAMSWQSVEVVAARGGSVEKFVFIQRGDQIFAPGFGERLRKTIKNIEGMEVVGFEVIESEPKRATPAGQQ